jgi:fucose 4-O-acetylase-like acetyltransferase
LLAQRRLSAGLYGVALAAFALCLPWAPAIDMKTLDFGVPGLSFAAALVGSMGLIFVAMLAEGRTGFGAVLEALGRASLVIMFLHMLVSMHLSPYLPGWVVTPLAVGIPFVVYIGMEQSAWARTLFLGMGAKRAIKESARAIA